MASSISLVSLPSIVNIIWSLRSFLPFKSSFWTLSGMVFNCSITSAGNSFKNPCSAAIVATSISGSSLCPTTLSIWPSKTALFSIMAILSLSMSTNTRLPTTNFLSSSFGHMTVTLPWIVYGINSPLPAYSKIVLPLPLLIIFSTLASA